MATDLDEIEYGVLIKTDVNVSKTSIGLYHGWFSWADGNGNEGSGGYYTDAPTNSNTSAAQDYWKPGVLIKDKMGSPSISCDFTGLGVYGSTSSFSFSIKRTGYTDVIDFLKWVKDNSVPLKNATVVAYTIKNKVFKQRWTGVLSEISSNTTTVQISCVDSSKLLHKDLTALFTPLNYPQYDPNDTTTFIPITLGRVDRAKLYKVSPIKIPQAITAVDSVNYFAAPVTAVSGSDTWTNPASVDQRYLTLKTNELSFDADDAQLIGKYLHCVKGGSDSSVLITHNESSGENLTQITVDGLFLDSSGFGLTPDITGGEEWWLECFALQDARIVSTNPLSEFANNGQLLGWDTNAIDPVTGLTVPAWKDLSGIRLSKDFSAISGYPNPGFLIEPEGTDLNSYFPVYNPLQIPAMILTAKSGDGSGGNFPSIDTDPTALHDKDQGTGYYRNYGGGIAGDDFAYTVTLRIYRDDIDSRLFGKNPIIPVVDFKVSVASSVDLFPATIIAVLKLTVYDIFGNAFSGAPDALFASQFVTEDGIGPKDYYVLAIPKQYYSDDSLSSPQYLDFKKNLETMTTYLSTFKNKEAIGYIDINVALRVIGGAFSFPSLVWYFNEIAFVVETPSWKDDIYTPTKGDVFADDWGGRKTPGNFIRYPTELIEQLMRQYDLVDPTTSIDNAAFDSASLVREWDLGNQINSPVNTLDKINEILMTSNMWMCVRHDGRRMLRVFGTYDGDDQIIDSSLMCEDSKIVITDLPIRLSYNSFIFHYAKNPVTGNYEKSLQILNVDQSGFPASYGNWKDFVVGISDYDTAAGLWQYCHNNWELNKVINTLEQNFDFVGSEENWGGNDDSGTMVKLLQDMIAYTFLRDRKKATLELKLVDAVLALEVGDPANFQDPSFMDNERVQGKVMGITDNNKKDRINVELLLLLPVPS